MKLLILVLLVALAPDDYAFAQSKQDKKSGFDQFLKSMFTPRNKAKVTAKPKRSKHRHGETRQRETKAEPRTVAVDQEWMARYWELEAAWDYPIPEDEEIKWKDGKYFVPFMVLKHYEDLANTPRRIARPQPDARTAIDPGFAGLD